MRRYFDNPGKVLLAAMLAFVAYTVAFHTKAWSQDIKPTFYIGAHAGASLANTALGIDGISLDGLGGETKSPFGGGRAGVDFKLPGSVVFIGGFATYTLQNVEFQLSDGTDAFKAALKNSWSVGGRAGMEIGGAKPYVLAAYRQTEMEWTNLSPGFPSAPTLKGYDVGVGIAIPVDKNLEIGVEGIWTKYQTHTVDTGWLPLTLDTDQLSVMAYVNFKFGGPEQASVAKTTAAPKAKRIAP